MDPSPQADKAPEPTVDWYAATHTIRLADARICRNEYFISTQIYARTGILTHNLLDLAGEHRAIFSIVLVGNQIADYLRLYVISGGYLPARRSATSVSWRGREFGSPGWPAMRYMASASSCGKPAKGPGGVRARGAGELYCHALVRAEGGRVAVARLIPPQRGRPTCTG